MCHRGPGQLAYAMTHTGSNIQRRWKPGEGKLPLDGQHGHWKELSHVLAPGPPEQHRRCQLQVRLVAGLMQKRAVALERWGNRAATIRHHYADDSVCLGQVTTAHLPQAQHVGADGTIPRQLLYIHDKYAATRTARPLQSQLGSIQHRRIHERLYRLCQYFVVNETLRDRI